MKVNDLFSHKFFTVVSLIVGVFAAIVGALNNYEIQNQPAPVVQQIVVPTPSPTPAILAASPSAKPSGIIKSTPTVKVSPTPAAK